MKTSAKSFYRIGRTLKGYSLLDWLHGHIYLRWPYFYIGVATGEYRLTKFFAPLYHWIMRLRPGHDFSDAANAQADGYHGKVMPLENATKLIQLDHPVQEEDLEQVIPYTHARSIILKDPDHIVVLNCPCRSVREHPCLPLDVCLIVGEPFASFAIEHHPNKARWITQQEAAYILKAENDRGHVHHAFFKDAMLGRYYAICNCCTCCCGAMQAHDHGIPMLASSGYLAKVDLAQCIRCRTCVEACPFHALDLSDNRLSVDENKCMGCGVCVTRCGQNAIQLRLAPEKGLPLLADELLETTKIKA